MSGWVTLVVPALLGAPVGAAITLVAQRAANKATLENQKATFAATMAAQRAMARDDRLWTSKVDVYTRLVGKLQETLVYLQSGAAPVRSGRLKQMSDSVHSHHGLFEALASDGTKRHFNTTDSWLQELVDERLTIEQQPGYEDGRRSFDELDAESWRPTSAAKLYRECAIDLIDMIRAELQEKPYDYRPIGIGPYNRRDNAESYSGRKARPRWRRLDPRSKPPRPSA